MSRDARNYEDRIGRLRVWLQRIASGEFGMLTIPAKARQAVEEDAELAEQYRGEAGED